MSWVECYHDAKVTYKKEFVVRDQVELLATDAKNRSWRTFLQGAAIDIGVALAVLVLASTNTITDQAGLIAFAIAFGKTFVTSAASYVMRRFLDPSGVPTPLPPADPGNPDTETPVASGELGAVDLLTLGIILLIAGIVVYFLFMPTLGLVLGIVGAVLILVTLVRR